MQRLSAAVTALVLTCGLAGSALAQPAAAAAQPGTAAAGALLFKARCAVCHGQQAEGTVLAPTLKGVVGSKAASTAFAKYTPALKTSGIIWTAAKLDTFLSGPSALVPGTAMAMVIPDATERKSVVAHLASLKK